MDGNHLEIVKALKGYGLEVLDLSRVGKGCPDILVSTASDMCLLEIKLPKKKLEKNQTKFHEDWKGKPIYTVTSAEEALKLMGITPGSWKIFQAKKES